MSAFPDEGFEVPASFTALVSGRPAEGYDDGDAWLARLPRLLRSALDAWDLTVDGQATHGMCALVLPVRRDGVPLVLKVSWPHHDAEHEHLALRAWAGRGAVRLVAADPARWALLLERLESAHDLLREPLDEACAVIGRLLAQLSRPAPPQLRRLSDVAEGTRSGFVDAPPQVPRRFVQQAAAHVDDLLRDPSVDRTLVHADLHFENVLHGARQPWLAIDPKPVAGEPAYGVAPVLWNRWPEALASGNVRRHLRRRLSIVCENAGIDEDRARAWTVVREVENAIWAVADGEPHRVTVAASIIKAVSG